MSINEEIKTLEKRARMRMEDHMTEYYPAKTNVVDGYLKTFMASLDKWFVEMREEDGPVDTWENDWIEEMIGEFTEFYNDYPMNEEDSVD